MTIDTVACVTPASFADNDIIQELSKTLHRTFATNSKNIISFKYPLLKPDSDNYYTFRGDIAITVLLNNGQGFTLSGPTKYNNGPTFNKTKVKDAYDAQVKNIIHNHLDTITNQLITRSWNK